VSAKEYLNRAYRIDSRISSKMEQLTQLKALATKSTVAYGGESVSRTRNVHSTEDVIVRIIEAERELDAQIDTLVDVKREIQQTINLVADTDCRLLLEHRYLCMKRWEQIGAELTLGRTQVYNLHQKALAMVETVLRTREETCNERP